MKDLTRRRFGLLRVLYLADRSDGRRYYVCRCDCGKRKDIRADHLHENSSCGCQTRKLRSQSLTKLIPAGTRFGKLTVVRRIRTMIGERHKYLCKCDCGKLTRIQRNSLVRSLTRSCGCSQLVEPPDPGTRFGRLTVVTGGKKPSTFACLCVCGRSITVRGCDLLSGKRRSCNCLYKETRKTAGFKHGQCRIKNKSPEYIAYHWERQTCRTAGSKYFDRYGRRGIEFRFDSFPEFFAAVGVRPSQDYRLTRTDPDGHFEKENLEWVERRRKRKN